MTLLMTTIIISHPYEKSFNMAILDKVIENLNNQNKKYTVIDLHQENFNPVLVKEELKLYNKGESGDPLVKKYNEILDITEHIIFIFPIWWYDMPAMLRGFFDKVMLYGTAFDSDGVNLTPLRKIPKTSIFTTSAASTKQLIEEFGDPVNGVMINGTFKVLGFEKATWHNMELIVDSTLEQRIKYLDEVSKHL
jgi:putative NADPH-quinone reductase